MEEEKNDEKTDKEMYDMAEHLKSLYDAKESELEKLREQNITLKKVIMSAYGSIRLLDQNFCNILLDEQANSLVTSSFDLSFLHLKLYVLCAISFLISSAILIACFPASFLKRTLSTTW